VPRAVPIVEAMTYLTLADHFLRSHTDRIAQINRSQNIDP
jgi:chorismate synthase